MLDSQQAKQSWIPLATGSGVTLPGDFGELHAASRYLRGSAEGLEAPRLILHLFVLQIMNGLCQLSQSTRLDGVSSLLEVYYCAPSNSGLAREQVIRKLLRFCPDLI